MGNDISLGDSIDNDPDELGISDALFDTIDEDDKVVYEPYGGHQPPKVTGIVTKRGERHIDISVKKTQGQTRVGARHTASAPMIYEVRPDDG